MTARTVPQAPGAVMPGAEQARVWVLEDAHSDASLQAVGIAERLQVPFRRVRLVWNVFAPLAALAPTGSLRGLAGPEAARRSMLSGGIPPLLLISAGRRSAAVGRWLRARFGCRLVQCAAPARYLPVERLPGHPDYDLLILPDGASGGANVVTVTGIPHRLSPAALRQAGDQWQERLEYLPTPRVALLLGGRPWGTDMEPARAHALGQRVAACVSAAGGSVMACVGPTTGGEAADALGAALNRVVHVLHRWNEPGENPYAGCLALADTVIVAGDAPVMLTQACATNVPVYTALPELCGPAQRKLASRLLALGQIRSFSGHLCSWPRVPLDETGRVADQIRRRFVVE